MQTPYVLYDKRNGPLDTSVTVPHRRRIVRDTRSHRFVFFPPDDDDEVVRFERRLHADGETLLYEDGFMLRYPSPYVERAADKIPLFSAPSGELDGFFSRIVASDDVVTIDGSGMYLQTLCSYAGNGHVLFGNLPELLLDVARANGLPLTRNEDFFVNHHFNYSLAYYASCGSPYAEIALHDSLETIRVGAAVGTELEDKFHCPALTGLPREERLDLLYERLGHVISEYCRYVDVDVIGHNLTGGRDSRASFALFLDRVPDRLEVVTGGMAYTQDRVISDHIVRRYGLSARTTADEQPGSIGFDYRAVMDKTDLLEWFVPLFRRIEVRTKFDPNAFEASGYLGNVITFSGTERNQIITDNRFRLTPEAERRVRANYDRQIERLRDAYGDRCHAAFNIMFNTTNKVASVCRRLKKHTLCIFELDVMQACYFAESAEDKAAGGLHYEMIRRADPALLYEVPFEHNKCFPDLPGTFELAGFRESGMPRPYKRFAEDNLESIVAHLREHAERLGFVEPAFFDLIESHRGGELPPLLVNKIYASLGTLEFQGVRFEADALVIERDGDHYTPAFFEQVYLERERFASGLPAMTYRPDLHFVSRVTLPIGSKLRVDIRSATGSGPLECRTRETRDGHVTACTLPADGQYRIVWSAHDPETKAVVQLYRTALVAKLKEPPERDGDATSDLPTTGRPAPGLATTPDREAA